jgi:methionyl-tRNA formyltransferase
MSDNLIVILAGYDYSDCFDGLDDYEFKVIVPSNEPMLDDTSLENLRLALGDKLLSVPYKNMSDQLDKLRPDILITFGWRRIISEYIISLPRLAVNVHPALLPEYKGYHPVPFVLSNNEEEHGITAHVIDRNLDSGPIVYQEKFGIDKFTTLNKLQRQVNELMPDFFKRLIVNLASGNFELSENDNTKTKVIAGRRKPSDSEIPLDVTMDRAYDLIRASDSERFPAFITIDGRRFVIRLEERND